MKKTNLLLLISLFIISICIAIVFFINVASSHVIESKKNMLLNEAKALFNNMVMTRLWSSSHGAVYVKKHDGIEPNPYLPDNTMTNSDGELYVKINPAWMTRQISEITNSRSNYYFKITSLNPINPHNKADKFETEGLEYFEKYKNEKYYYKFSDELNKFDFIGRLDTQPECLQCHAQQGYEVGELRGGIRVSIPIEEVVHSIITIKENRVYFSIFIVLILIIIWFILYNFITKIFIQQKSLKDLNSSLEEKVKIEVEKNIQKEIQLSNQAKLVAMGEMIGNIAHQWRQPLSVISTSATGLMLQKEHDILDDENLLKSLDIINDQSQYLSKTIDDFKNFIRGDKTAVSFHLKNNIDSFIKLIDSSIKTYQIQVFLELEEDLELQGFPNELIQCFINIFNNSKDAFLENNIPNQERVVFIRQHIVEDFVVIEFQDSAGGIPEDILDKIFQAYFTTKTDSNGTGLGLHMVKDILSHMGGSIKVTNEEYEHLSKTYKGAKFKIQFPFK